MHLVRSKLDYAQIQRRSPERFLFTGNSYVNKRGELVMGRGAAADVKALHPYVARLLGAEIPHMGVYGLIWSPVPHNLGVFQVKRHFREQAEYQLIARAAEQLAEEAFTRFDTAFHLNFPGIGWGGLDREKVLPMLTPLPDNVIIYEE